MKKKDPTIEGPAGKGRGPGKETPRPSPAGSANKPAITSSMTKSYLADIFEIAMDGIFIIDLGGRYRDVNPSGCEMFGYARDEFLASDVRLLLFPQDVEAAFKMGATHWRTGAFLPEYRMRRKDGSEIWVEMTIRPLKAGGEDLVMGIKRDITERKKAEDRISALKEFYENIVETVPLGIHVVDGAFTVRSWNRYFEDYTSIKKEEIIGKNLFDAYPSLAANGWDVHYMKVMETGEPFSKDDYKFIKRVGPDKGKVVYQRTRILPLKDAGRVSGAITILEDVTERIQAEYKYSTMIRTATDGFMIIGPLGHIVDVNDAYCGLTGYARRELMTKGIWDVDAFESPEDIARRISRIMEAGSERFEARHRCKDGSTVDLDVSANFIDMAGGMFFVFYRDITERKKMEERLRTLSYGIEHNPTPVMIFNIAGEIEYVNQGFCEDTGYGREELVGKNIGIIRSDVHTPEFFKKMWDTITSGEVWMGDVCNRRKNGEKFWELKTVAPLKDSGGRITHFISIKIDDIERTRALEALRASEEKYRSLVDNLNVGVFRMHAAPECRFLQLNPAIVHIFGYAFAGELVDTEFQRLFKNQADMDAFVRELGSSGGAVMNRMYQFKKKDGTPIWASVSAKAQHGEDGTIKWIDGVIEDITERKHLEDRLHELSVMDELTGLYNRRGFLTLAEQELKVARRLGNDVILFFADLDGMKEINDNLGHKAGDGALIDAADILRESFRESDVIARIGGDEFVVLVMQNTDVKCELLNNRLQEKINEFNEQVVRPYKVSISFGIATTGAHDPVGIDELVTRADKRMYEQKRRKQKV